MRMDIHTVCEGVWFIEINFPFRVEYDGQLTGGGEIELCFTREDNGKILNVALEKLREDCLVFGQINKKTWRGTAYSQETYERIVTTGDYFYTTGK